MSGGDMGGSENVEEIKLKPCPFCGGDAELYRTKRDKRKVFGIYHMIAAIKCKSCTAEVRQAGYDADKAFENASNIWNKRVGQVSEKAVRNIVKPEFLHMISDTRYIAKYKCGKRITADIDDRYNPNFCSKCGAEFDWSEDGG